MPLDRLLFKEIAKDIRRREIGIIVGPRQVGKTTLLSQISKHCVRNRIKHHYFNLEDPKDALFFAQGFEIILEKLGKERKTLLIDEFHYLPNATKLFKTIFDVYKKIKIFASGSSSIEIHRHLKESLAGRRHLYRLHPLSFSEWLPSKSKALKLPKNISSKIVPAKHKKLRRLLAEFIIYGGMPGMVHEKSYDNMKKLLIDLISTYIQKDVKALLREEDVLSFNRLLNLLASQDGQVLSENSLSQDLNYSLRQVRKDIFILNQMFLLDILKPFFTNRGRELKQTNKLYFFDTGIRNALLNDFRELSNRSDKGMLYESFVLNEIKKNLKIYQEIYYWRTRQKDEVDFIVVENRQPIAIEVKSRLKNPEIPHGILRFLSNYPECKLAVIFNEDLQKTLKYRQSKVLFLPHYYAYLIPGLCSELYN